MISSTYTGEIYNSSSSANEPERSDTENGLGQEAFLKMFLAQVTSQDPLNPMDNTEFTAQLATFSQLEQLTNIANSMESLGSMEAAVQKNTTMSYIGRDITVSGSSLAVTDGEAGVISYTLATTGDVRVVITNASDETVCTRELGQLTEGRNHFAWDGLNNRGETVPNGTYTVTLTAYDSEGEAIEISDTTVTDLCTGYEVDEAGNQYLVMGSGAVPVEDVLGVTMPSSETTAASASTAKTGSEDDDITLEDVVSTVLKVGGLAAALL